MNNSWQSLKEYLIFAGLAAASVILLSQFDVTYAHPSQKESLRLITLLPILVLAALGSWLWGRSNLPVLPRERTALFSILLRLVGMGAAIGLLGVMLDYGLGFSRLFASKLGIKSIHIAFPYSAFAYTAGAVVIESLYRLIPIPIAVWIGRLVLRERGMPIIFWVVAILMSLIEPLSQASVLSDQPFIFAVIAIFIFFFNLLQASLLKRYGVAAPLITRISFYLIWHVAVGPLIVYSR